MSMSKVSKLDRLDHFLKNADVFCSISMVINVFCLSPRRWQQSDKSGMTELVPGSASDKSEEIRNLHKKRRTSLRTKMWTSSSSRALQKIEEILFTVQFSIAFMVLDN